MVSPTQGAVYVFGSVMVWSSVRVLASGWRQRSTRTISIAMGIAKVIEPGAFVVSGRGDDESVSVPFADRISHPSWIGILRELSAVGPDLPPYLVVLHVDYHSVGSLDDIERAQIRLV